MSKHRDRPEKPRKEAGGATGEIHNGSGLWDSTLLEVRGRQFKKTPNPVLVLEAFMIAVQGELDIPEWVIVWLNEKFGAWHKENGLKSLDTIMGLSPKRGQEPPMKRLLIDERNQNLAVSMFRLIQLGATINEAAHMVAERLCSKEWNTSGWKIDEIKADTIVAMWTKCWREKYKFDDDYSKRHPPFSGEELTEFMSRFPTHSIPSHLKNAK